MMCCECQIDLKEKPYYCRPGSLKFPLEYIVWPVLEFRYAIVPFLYIEESLRQGSSPFAVIVEV